MTRNLEASDSMDPWKYSADLSNGAKIKFSLVGEDRLMTSYQRAGTKDWRQPITAVLGDDSEVVDLVEDKLVKQDDILEKRWSQDGRAYSKADFMRYFGSTREWDAAQLVVAGEAPPKAQTWRGEDQDQVLKGAVLSQLRNSLLDLLTDKEEEDDSLISGAFSMAIRLRQAWPTVRSLPKRLFDILTPMPIGEKVSEEAVDRALDEKQNTPDPKKTIVPVPAVRLMPTLAHPVSPNEEQMLRLFVGDPRNTAYNLSNAFRATVKLDPMQVEFCHSLIIQRHDVLRSAFWQEGMDPLRRVEQESQVPLHVLAVKDESEMHVVQGTDYMTGHQLGVTPMRANAFCSHSSACGIGLNLHHIVADADGMGLYSAEAFQISMYLSQGFSEEAVAERLPALPVQFVDFAYWQKSLSSKGLVDSDLGYWFHQVTACAPPAVLDVPIDKPRPRVWVAVGSSQRIMFEVEVVQLLNEVSGRATPFAVAFATMAVTLTRFSGSPSTLIAVPFALRSLPVLSNLIGNFLNMMPVRTSHDSGGTYISTLDRVAVQAVDVQRYALAPFITLLQTTQKHFGMQDPSRNPVYSTMIDLVPNASEDPNTGLSGVLDWFLFANTRNGMIWSLDAVYNTFILEQQTVKMMLLHMLSVHFHVARSPRVPVPRTLAGLEAVQDTKDGVDLTHVYVRSSFLPQVVGVKSGWEIENGSREYLLVRQADRFKRMSGLELTADYPPSVLSSLRAPGQAAPRGPSVKPRHVAGEAVDEAALAKAVRPPAARTEEDLAEEAEARRAELARRKQRSYEVATLWAKTARQSELISLEQDEEADPYAHESANDWHSRKWNPKGVGPESGDLMGRARKRSSAAGRGRSS
uniref:Condensation domain-containing protein n=1 Tax=Alexandrium catenella TaxID=2925 RepID=A0A7S1RZZ6_ALECA